MSSKLFYHLFLLGRLLLPVAVAAAVYAAVACSEDSGDSSSEAVQQYQLPGNSNTAMVIRLDYRCSNGATGRACCGLYARQGGDSPVDLDNADLATFPIESPGYMWVPSDSAENWHIGVESIDGRCIVEGAPGIEAEASLDDSDDLDNLLTERVSATGQLESYEVSLAKIGSRYFLWDYTRSSGFQLVSDNEGGLAQGHSIATAAFSNYRDGTAYLDPYLSTDNPQSASPLMKDALDAQYNAQRVYDWLWRSSLNDDGTGLNSYDDVGGAMLSVVNLDFPLEATQFCGQTVPAGSLTNAFWSPEAASIFVTKNVSNNRASYSADIDVIAHEWGHGISDSAVSGNGRREFLEYERESGALSEAFSDWVAAVVDEYYGDSEDQWIVGEDTDSSGNLAGIRSLESPRLYGDPDTYQDDFWEPATEALCPEPDICINDYCGVHINSGVANKMFYLLSEGGSHNGVDVNGIGSEVALRIALEAARNYWTSTTNFASARDSMVAAADSLDLGSSVASAVSDAWEAVGIE